MLNLSLGSWNSRCDGVTRRDMIKIGSLAIGGLALPDILRARESAKKSGNSSGKKSVICLWLDGGPTHIETFDPKPDAPAEYRGPVGAIQTKVPGMLLNEYFVKTSQVADKINIVRSVHHNNGDHFAAAHWMWTGYFGSTAANLDPMYPGIGAIVSKQKGSNKPGMPASVSIPHAMTIGRRPGYQGGAYLGSSYNPFDVGSDPNRKNFKVRNIDLPRGVTKDRAIDRKALLAGLDRVKRDVDATGMMEGIDYFNQQAFDLVTGKEAAKAFDIEKEDAKLRDRYGRNSVGQGMLLARRLVEAGVTFVSVHSGGWDNHSRIEQAMRSHGPRTDAALGTLIADLDQRGMLDDVMVLVMGEFGRTPKVNRQAGRDHWGNVMSVVLCGGGLKSGQIVGSSGDKGIRPIERAVKPPHILHTIYRQLGIDPKNHFYNLAGRPIPILNEGEPLAELL